MHCTHHRRFSLQRARASDEVSRMRESVDKYRINPGNVGAGQRRDEQFSTICKIAVDNGKPVRIGVNGGSLNQELVMRKMQENTDKNLGKESEEIINDCMVLSALQSTELALESGLRADQIIISCKTSRPRDLITVYRDLSAKTEQPLHLGLTEGGHGDEGTDLVCGVAGRAALRRHWRIRFAFRSRPNRAGIGGKKVYAACELLQALGLRSFAPSVTARALAAVGRRAPHFRSWPRLSKATFATACPSGRRNTKA